MKEFTVVCLRRHLLVFYLVFGIASWVYAQTETSQEISVSESPVIEESGTEEFGVENPDFVDPDLQEDMEETKESATNEDESFDVHELQELVVKSRRAVVEGNKIIVVPTKSEKKLSNSPASLIDQMQFPGLKVKDGAISSIDGKEVVVFINGVRADGIDYQTFWPKRTVKVEYLVNSLDPTFEGAERVVNFIVDEPKTGGVTRLEAYQAFPSNGIYSATSKLVTGNMTYGFNFSGRYDNDKTTKETGEETYSNLWYKDEYYDNITRTFSTNTPFRYKNIGTALNARYKKDNIYILHTIGFNWRETPDNSSSDQLWTPGIFDAISARTRASSRSITPQASGYYSVQTSKLFYLIGLWKYSYTDADRNSTYDQTGYPSITNASKEKVHAITIGLRPALFKQNKWMLQMESALDINLFNTRYSGTADTRQKMSRYNFNCGLNFSYSITPTLGFAIMPGIVVLNSKVADISTSETKPTVSGSMWWMPGSKFSMNGGVSYNLLSREAKDLNPVLTKVSDLEWSMGNPYLKNNDLWYYHITGSYLISNAINLSCNVMYTDERNAMIEVYTANPKEMEGVLRTFSNVPTTHYLSVSPDINLRLFNSKVNITLSPAYQYNHYSGVETPYRTLSQFRGSARISTTIRNVAVSLSYRTRSKYITYGGFQKGKSPDNLDMSVTYGTGDLLISAGVSDILHSHYKSTSEYLSPVYSFFKTKEMRGRQAWVNLTYFFGYGKKTDRSINIESVSAGPTSVL